MSMTPKNITAGFRTTGVYPINRDALLLPEETSDKSDNLALAYIPLYTPAKTHGKAKIQSNPASTSITLGLADSEEDGVYSESSEDKYQLCESSSGPFLGQLHLPSPPPDLPTINADPSDRLLTSSESIQRMEVKIKKKERKLEEREERARKREEGNALDTESKPYEENCNTAKEIHW